MSGWRKPVRETESRAGRLLLPASPEQTLRRERQKSFVFSPRWWVVAGGCARIKTDNRYHHDDRGHIFEALNHCSVLPHSQATSEGSIQLGDEHEATKIARGRGSNWRTFLTTTSTPPSKQHAKGSLMRPTSSSNL